MLHNGILFQGFCWDNEQQVQPHGGEEIAMMEEEDSFVFVDGNHQLNSTVTEAANVDDDHKMFVVAEECEEKKSTKVEESNQKKRSLNDEKENLKLKPNYIHVRARRGQATDSHSLAERARREKISKKMKCLQDLVPGCSKVVGKAGVLDEIINYVQSLQRQVEFLSMKLASQDPRIGFNIENFTAHEGTPASAANFAISSASANLAELQLNRGQELTARYDIERQIYNAAETATSSSVSILEPYIMDSLGFRQMQHLPTWESDLLSLEDGVPDQE